MTAVYVGEYAPGSAEWREHRKDKIGGSDLAAILGLSKWQSAYSLFHERRGAITVDDDKPQLTWGTLLEPVIAQHFAGQHPEFTVQYEPGAVWAHSERPWQVVSPDARLSAQRPGSSMLAVVGGLECKTSRYDYDWQDGVPPYYEVQAQWAMDVFQVPTWHFAVLFSGSDYQEFTVEAHAATQEALRDAASDFLDSLQTGLVPPIDGHDTTYQAIRQLHPDLTDEAVEVGEVGQRWVDAKRRIAEAEDAEKEKRSALALSMGTARRALLDGKPIATRQSNKGGTPFVKAVNGLLAS